jgi:hypothetical protein
VTAGLMLLVYSLTSAQNTGIGSIQTLEFLLLSVIVLALFLLIEYRSKAPLMPLGFLRRGSIFGANTVGLLQVGPFVGMVFILTDYLQQVRGYSALYAGLAFIPMGIVFLVISVFLSARLVNRFGVKPIIIEHPQKWHQSYFYCDRVFCGTQLWFHIDQFKESICISFDKN